MCYAHIHFLTVFVLGPRKPKKGNEKEVKTKRIVTWELRRLISIWETSKWNKFLPVDLKDNLEQL